eukprot:6458008-Amphidinium_carterae.2
MSDKQQLTFASGTLRANAHNTDTQPDFKLLKLPKAPAVTANFEDRTSHKAKVCCCKHTKLDAVGSSVT